MDALQIPRHSSGDLHVFTSCSIVWLEARFAYCGKGGRSLRIEIQNVSMTYQSPEGEIPALRDVSFSVADGAFVSIVGPSGCGKSTLLSLIAGLEQPTAGEVLLDGVRVERPDGKIGLMPQRDQLFEWRTVWRNVLLGPELRGEDTQIRQNEIGRLLAQYALTGFASKQPGQLSGGMRQRCALIRTLAVEPEILLLDEPFSALDYQTRLAVSADIARIIRSSNKTAVLVTHDISEALSMSDEVVVLSHRPGTVKHIHRLDALRGVSAMERRGMREFQELFHEIWGELDVNV